MSKKQNGGEFKISADVKDFIGLTFKKWKKHSADPYLGKKEAKKEYYKVLVELLPDVITMVVRYSNRKEVRELMPQVYERLSDEKFIKMLKKMIDNEDIKSVDNYEQLPIVIFDFLRHTSEWEKKLTEENGGKQVKIDNSDLVEVSGLLLKKKMKRATGKGVPEGLAFDVLSVIPTTSLMERSSMYRLRQAFLIIYEHAKTEKITPEIFDALMKSVLKEDYYPQLCTYLLLERKEIYTQFTEEQKEFFNQVTDWVMNRIEEMSKATIDDILTAYFAARKRDKNSQNDSNRRFFLSSLPEEEFPKITKVLNKLTTEHEEYKEFV